MLATMSAHSTNVALIQMPCSGKPEQNLAKATAMIEKAAKDGANIVALPELFLSPYFCQKPDDTRAFEGAEPVPGPTTDALAKIAKAHGIVLVGGSVFEKTGDGTYYNTAAIFGPDGALLRTYRKTHIPEDNLYHEKHYFAPGDTGIEPVETPFGTIAVLICYDQWYPEAARIAALKGAQILFYPTAIGVIDEKVEENVTGDWEQMWRNAMLGHAAANNVYVAAINRIGREGHIDFWGGSFLADPSSAILAKAGSEETIVSAHCDLSRVKELQEAWRFLEMRRPESYGALTKRT